MSQRPGSPPSPSLLRPLQVGDIGWIAHRQGLLYVEPDARGLGLGRQLTQECINFARAAGYRRMVLWTNDVLTAARHIYLGAGFVLTSEERHHSFGKDMVGQHWLLDLRSVSTYLKR